MNKKEHFYFLRDERTKLVNEIADLQTENVQLREAAAHFLDCSLCKAGYAVNKDSECFKHVFVFLTPEQRKAV